MTDTLVDGHAHFHQCFPLTTFLQSAIENFHLAAPNHFAGVLLLAHIEAGDPLQRIRNELHLLDAPWTVTQPESSSIVFYHPEKSPIVFIAGRQIATKEKLELLSLCSTAKLPWGQSLRETVDATVDSGGVPVLPWGFGKWWFERGRSLRSLLERLDVTKPCFLGDNGCRLTLHRPRLLRVSENHGFYVLAGSDPLPLPSHVNRPASFGSALRSQIDLDAPTVWMKEALMGLNDSPRTFGKCRNPVEFGIDQLRVRYGR